MIVNRVIGGNGGLTASIFVTGLSETDTVTATKDGKTYSGKWVSKPNPACVVPDGYTQLEYIGSDGNQYIDTGINGGDSDIFEFTYQFTESTGTWQLFGCESNNSPIIERRFGITKTPTWWVDSFDTGVSADYNKHNIRVDWNTAKYSIDSNEKSFTKDSSQSPARYTTHLFRCGGDHTTKFINKSRLYSFKYYQGSTLVREYIPCKRNSDNTIGLYDLVTNTFYTNSGTGSFVAGAEVPQTIDGFLIDNIKSYGTYTITATDGTNTATQDVLVDMATQYDIAMGYETNTLYLYYFGDECEDVTGGWISFTTEGSAVKAFYDSADSGYWFGGMGTFTKNSDNFYYSASNRNMADIQTANAIDLTDYTYCVVKYTNIAQNSWGAAACGLVNNSVVNDFDLSTGSSISGLRNGSNTSYLVLVDFTEIKTAVGNIANVYYQQESHSGTAASRVYMMAFSKSDDISSLSSYGSTISSIISNSASLLSNETAIKNMINKCTGDFMWTALSDSTFVNNLKASAHYSIVSSDSNWKKALSLLDIL